MIKFLPPDFNANDPNLLKQTIAAARSLGELKGAIATVPNENILLDTLVNNEAKSSSAIENIITTYDNLYIASIDETNITHSTKEAKNYAEAIKYGYELVKKNELITVNNIITIQKINAPKYAEIRRIPGTILKKDKTGETVYTPPQDYNKIMDLLTDLERFINDDKFSYLDPLIKMAIIHHQFESIHPFHDGNGRIGRILNILYLSKEKLISLPILYLSEYIIERKSDYYHLLQSVRDQGNWLDWCLWLIKGVEITAKSTIKKVNKIRKLMLEYKTKIREKHRFYSQDLINVLFRYPYTKIEFVEKELRIHRHTATTYLDRLAEDKFLEKKKLGKSNFYFNNALFNILIGEDNE